MRIGLFVPCYIDAFFPAVGIATLELLERFGHEVVQAIRLNQPQLERPLPAVPLFDDAPPSSLLAAFKDSLERMGGLFLCPSATAYIEGVLIHGAQGVRSLSVLPVAHTTGRSTQSLETTA
jgi:hypothetical protein